LGREENWCTHSKGSSGILFARPKLIRKAHEKELILGDTSESVTGVPVFLVDFFLQKTKKV